MWARKSVIGKFLKANPSSSSSLSLVVSGSSVKTVRNVVSKLYALFSYSLFSSLRFIQLPLIVSLFFIFSVARDNSTPQLLGRISFNCKIQEMCHLYFPKLKGTTEQSQDILSFVEMIPQQPLPRRYHHYIQKFSVNKVRKIIIRHG